MIELPFREFIAQLAARTPTPGGGGAAAFTATMGASLCAMAVRFCAGKEAAAGREADLAAVEHALDLCIEKLLPMAERDAASFERVAEAYRLPRSDDAADAVRTRAIQEALAGASVVPEEIVCMARDALAATARVVDCVGRALITDLGAGVELLDAAARSAELLVRINASYLKDRELARVTLERVGSVVTELRGHADAVRAQVESRIARS